MSSIEDEVAFLSAVGADNRVAPVSFGVWSSQGTDDTPAPVTPPFYASPVSDTYKWDDPRPGTPAAITYIFNPGWSPAEQHAFRGAMALWEAVANVRLTEVTVAAEADFQIVSASDGKAVWNNQPFTYPRIGSPTLGSLSTGNARNNLSIDVENYMGGDIDSFDTGKGFATMTLAHELGHMLGLGHGGPYNFDVNRQVQQFGPYDTKLWTLMSYIGPEETAFYANQYPVTGTDWQGYQPLTPMIADILAMQRLYGAATSGPLTGGGKVFGFDTNIQGAIRPYYDFDFNKHAIVTIWESGSNNTLNLSKYTQDAVIDLHAGSFSSAGGLKNNIAIAFGTIIDHAIGGSGNDMITASDVASTLIGGAGLDRLHGGAGNDVLTGGADPDLIDGGGGLDILRDTLANMSNDEVFNFGYGTTIEVMGVLVGRDHLLVAVDPDGDTTIGMGGTEMLLSGTFDGGEFMAAARNSGAGMHTDLAFVPYLPQLFEGVSVAPNAVNGVANQPFLSGDGVVHFSVTLQAAISAFTNTLGYYRVATDGTITGVDILYADTRAAGPATVALATPASGEQIGFFLLQNGFGQFGALPHDLSFVAQGGGAAHYDAGQPVFLQSATLGLLAGATIFHSFQDLNPGDAIQVLSGVSPGGYDLRMGFEDLAYGTGDNDFQDVVIAIHTDRDGVFFL